MAEMGLAVAGAAGNVAGAKVADMAGNLLGGDSGSSQDTMFQTPSFVNQMNTILDNALQSAIQTSTGYTQAATERQDAGLKAATGALSTGLTNATQQATDTSNQGFKQAQALQAPYTSAGYGALDAYQDSLGLKRASVGSDALSKALTAQVNTNQNLTQLQQAGLLNPDGTIKSTPDAPGTGLTAPDKAALIKQINDDQINQYIKQNLKEVRLSNNKVVPGGGKSFSGLQYTGAGADPTYVAYTNKGGGGPNQLIQNQAIRNAAQDYLAQQQYDTANKTYQQQVGQQQGLLNTYNQNTSGLIGNITPEQLALAVKYRNGGV